jgi:hypothetical protein
LIRLKERLDFVVDEGKRALMCYSAVRTLSSLAAFAHEVTMPKSLKTVDRTKMVLLIIAKYHPENHAIFH